MAVDVYGIPMRRLVRVYCRRSLAYVIRQPSGLGRCQRCGKLHKVVW